MTLRHLPLAHYGLCLLLLMRLSRGGDSGTDTPATASKVRGGSRREAATVLGVVGCKRAFFIVEEHRGGLVWRDLGVKLLLVCNKVELGLTWSTSSYCSEIGDTILEGSRGEVEILLILLNLKSLGLSGGGRIGAWGELGGT